MNTQRFESGGAPVHPASAYSNFKRERGMRISFSWPSRLLRPQALASKSGFNHAKVLSSHIGSSKWCLCNIRTKCPYETAKSAGKHFCPAPWVVTEPWYRLHSVSTSLLLYRISILNLNILPVTASSSTPSLISLLRSFLARRLRILLGWPSNHVLYSATRKVPDLLASRATNAVSSPTDQTT